MYPVTCVTEYPAVRVYYRDIGINIILGGIKNGTAFYKKY
jgi:hypothetical protein